MQVAVVTRSFWNEPMVTIIEELEPIKGGAELAIVSCTLLLPTELVEILVMVVSIQVKALEDPIIPKPMPLVTHASEVFKTPDIVLKDTPITKRVEFQLFPLGESINTIGEQLVDTIGEQHVDDLVAGVKHVVLGD
jgi:hypothetical protein